MVFISTMDLSAGLVISGPVEDYVILEVVVHRASQGQAA